MGRACPRISPQLPGLSQIFQPRTHPPQDLASSVQTGSAGSKRTNSTIKIYVKGTADINWSGLSFEDLYTRFTKEPSNLCLNKKCRVILVYISKAL